MGTHPTSPSRVYDHLSATSPTGLVAHPHLQDGAYGNLPFHFKVLSIGKALSIQSHLDKRTAEFLHAQHPHIYKGTVRTVLSAPTTI